MKKIVSIVLSFTLLFTLLAVQTVSIPNSQKVF